MCQQNPPSKCVGVFGLSIRTTERDLEDLVTKHGRVEKVVVVYDQRVSFSARSRGFAFVYMDTVEDARAVVDGLNGVELHGRNIRVDYSLTSSAHDPTPGQYMGFKDRRPS
ncbi:RNA-binding domain-containing protein, partial [Atractiella rhizophila]